MKIKNILKKRALSPDIEHSSLGTHTKLFSETTADTFNMGQISTLSSPMAKSRSTIQNNKKNKSLINGRSKSFIFNTFSVDEKEEDSVEPSPYTLNPKVMETWLNEVLIDAKHLDLKS